MGDLAYWLESVFRSDQLLFSKLQMLFQASVTESLIKLCHNIFPVEEEKEEEEEKVEDETEELAEEIDIAVFLQEVETQNLPSSDPSCSPVVLRRAPAGAAANTVQRLSSGGGRSINFRDTIRRFASPVLLRRRHSDADSIGAELGTESPKEEIIRRSLRLRDRIVSALSPQRLSEGSFKGSLEPRALSFTSIEDSERTSEDVLSPAKSKLEKCHRMTDRQTYNLHSKPAFCTQ